MSDWQHRQCPACRAVFAAGELRPLDPGGPNWQRDGSMLRNCPSCGHRAPTRVFPIVSESAAYGGPSAEAVMNGVARVLARVARRKAGQEAKED